MCSNALIKVFREDTTGTSSLEIVRLINRMVKERHFKVHRNALSCLLQLRLRTELGVRASDRYADKPQATKIKTKKKDRVHLSKKAKTVRKEQKEIDKEFREAEAVVDQEERKGVVSYNLSSAYGPKQIEADSNSSKLKRSSCSLHSISESSRIRHRRPCCHPPFPGSHDSHILSTSISSRT